MEEKNPDVSDRLVPFKKTIKQNKNNPNLSFPTQQQFLSITAKATEEKSICEHKKTFHVRGGGREGGERKRDKM